MVTIGSYYLQYEYNNMMASDEEKDLLKKIPAEKDLFYVVVALFFEHVLSYLIQFFRDYDIRRNGVLDITGVPHAPTESMLASI